MKRRGFTLIELLVVVAIIALLIAILLPSLGKARELANRGTCAANVRGIAQSMHVYGVDNNDVYPVVATPSNNSTPTYKLASTAQAAGDTTIDLTYKSIYQTNAQTNAGSPMACLWILCIRGDVAPKQFLCKSDPIGGASSSLLNSASPAQYYTNFNDAQNAASADNHYSYGISYPWTPSANSAPGGWWKATSDASIVLLADISPKNGTPTGVNASTPGNPYSTNTKLSNSIHHQRDGQNIAYGDAHAEFQRTPFAGQGGDNVYTVGLSGPGTYANNPSNPITTSGTIPSGWSGGSSGSYDTILIPSADASINSRF